ncbi:MAG: c-type cytochrome [Rubellimicrobium sp.]|nr:c-type cytochrome [Rubellimicrobium sp.]
MKALIAGAALVLLAAPVLADGDAAAGEAQFGRQCVTCHVIQDHDGNTIAGRNANTGPNLYAIVGEKPGDVEGFSFGDSIVAWGETGAVWDEDNFVGYVMNPTGWLREVTGNNRARAKMAFQVRDEQQARDIWAYLVSIQPEE